MQNSWFIPQEFSSFDEEALPQVCTGNGACAKQLWKRTKVDKPDGRRARPALFLV
jgi:hypothetical protein